MSKFDRQTIEARVKEILVSHLDVDENVIKPESILRDLDVDSLDVVEVVMQLEHDFEITITDQQADSMEGWKVSEICDLVERLA